MNYYFQVIWKWKIRPHSKAETNHYLIRINKGDWYELLKQQVETRYGTSDQEVLHWDGHEIKDIEHYYYSKFCQQL
jgi:CYTH domain-containing protein